MKYLDGEIVKFRVVGYLMKLNEHVPLVFAAMKDPTTCQDV